MDEFVPRSIAEQLVHVPVVADLALDLEHAHVLGVLEELGGEDEFVEPLVLAEDDLPVAALPFLVALVHVEDSVADLHHAVHVVRVHDRGDVEIRGDLADELVDHE